MMQTILIAVLTAAQAYLLGSVDTGILISKFVYHDDVRNHGSGAAGMTNMLRTFGKKAAALTAAGDVLKGVAAVCIGRWLFHFLPADAGISAVIATDISTILYCRRRGVPVHISTQANISNTEAVRYYAQWAETVVLSRELNLTQVEAIHRAIVSEPILGPGGKPVSIEMFCHGALCMAVSGKCYLSLHAMNSSANRGACTQICRRAYRLSDKDSDNEIEVDNEFLMSPKDLKTIHFLDRMVDAGVRVFKIEGRARGPEYVAATVSCYDEALRAICDGSFGEEKVRGWDERLARVFNRGFWNGYYLGQRLGEWSGKYGSSATRTKSYAARPLRYFPRLGVAEFLLEAGEIRVGDELLVTGPTTGALEFKAGELRLDSGVTDKVVKGDVFSVAVPAKIRLSDRLYLLR